eukprot:6175493-Pleurochrysis_carterae.AAC.5
MSMCLTKTWHHSNRAYAADSWFIGFDPCEALLTNKVRCVHARTFSLLYACVLAGCLSVSSVRVRAQGIYAFGGVKTLTSRYPLKEMAAATKDVPGACAVMTTARMASWTSIYAATRRRGGE